MTLFKNKYRVESTRLKGRDYAEEGYYFVTVCVKDKKPFFGYIQNKEMILNEKGTIAKETWYKLPEHYKKIRLHEFIVMPDHVHGIIEICRAVTAKPNRAAVGNVVETGFKPVSTKHPLSEVVRGFKTFSARKINEKAGTPGRAVWQPRFYDRIIRSEFELYFVSEYIKNNPIKAETGYDDENMTMEMEKQTHDNPKL